MKVSKSRTKDGSVRRTSSVGNFTYLGIVSKGQIFVSVLALLWSSYWLFKNLGILLREFIRFYDVRNLQSFCQGSYLNSNSAMCLTYCGQPPAFSTAERVTEMLLWLEASYAAWAPWMLLGIDLALMQSRIRVATTVLQAFYVTVLKVNKEFCI